MGISLNNHESRIKALENKGSGSWSKGTNSTGGYGKEGSTGLLIQWGYVNHPNNDGSVGVTLPTSFTTTIYTVQVTGNKNDGEWSQGFYVTSKATDRFVIGKRGSSQTAYWLAIGYLISDRILNYAYACKSLLFTPLKKIGGVK